MPVWRPRVNKDKAHFCHGRRECQRGVPRGNAKGPTCKVTVLGRVAMPLVSKGTTWRKGCALLMVFGVLHVSNMQRWKWQQSKLLQ